MLKQIERSELPSRRRGEKSPIRRFADQTVAEFVKTVKGREVVEVTGWPEDAGRDAIGNAERAAGAIRDALFYMDRDADMRKKVKVTRCRERVFMERCAPYRPESNPYPGDMPRVHLERR